MTKREVCFVIARGRIAWSDVSSSPAALPDSRARWEAIWTLRDELDEIAHSHPLGPHAFSSEDVTTMDALDAALGRPLRYSVVSPEGMVIRGGESQSGEPWWAPLLRAASGMTQKL